MEVINITKDAEVFTANAYLVLGETNALVDVGVMKGVEEVIEEHTSDLEKVVLTHQHGDHVGELDTVLEHFGASLQCYDEHPRRSSKLEGGNSVKLGDETFEVVYTPGHSDDHIAFLSNTTLFSGDVVVHNDGAFDYGSFGRTDRAGQSRELLIQSIQNLLEKIPNEVEHMYSGHGDVFHGDVRDVVETALERAEMRKPKYPD